MTENQTEEQLLEAVKRLEAASDKIIKSNGYTMDAKQMRLLIELIKEQVRNENSMSTARQIR